MTEHNERLTALSAASETVQGRANHLKQRKRRFGPRTGVFCLSVLLFAVVLSVGGTFSKYTSTSFGLAIPSLTAEDFAFSAKAMTDDEKTEYNAELALADKQLLAYAFTVCNQEGERVSAVDLTCDLDFSCDFVVDTSKAYWGGFTEDMLEKLAREELKVYLYVDGEQKAELVNDPSGAADAPAAGDKETKLPMKFILRDSDAIYLKAASEGSAKKCAIVIDFSGYDHTESSLLRQLSDAPTVTVTANQVKGGA